MIYVLSILGPMILFFAVGFMMELAITFYGGSILMYAVRLILVMLAGVAIITCLFGQVQSISPTMSPIKSVVVYAIPYLLGVIAGFAIIPNKIRR